MEGRLRLPHHLFDDYNRCVVSLGVFSRHYLQIMPDGVYLAFLDTLEGKWKAPGDTPAILDEKLGDIGDRLSTASKLRMDDTGRIKIPLEILKEGGIMPGAWVVGQARGLERQFYPEGSMTKPGYWALWDKAGWLEQNPQGALSLDLVGDSATA